MDLLVSFWCTASLVSAQAAYCTTHQAKWFERVRTNKQIILSAPTMDLSTSWCTASLGLWSRQEDTLRPSLWTCCGHYICLLGHQLQRDCSAIKSVFCLTVFHAKFLLRRINSGSFLPICCKQLWNLLFTTFVVVLFHLLVGYRLLQYRYSEEVCVMLGLVFDAAQAGMLSKFVFHAKFLLRRIAVEASCRSAASSS